MNDLLTRVELILETILKVLLAIQDPKFGGGVEALAKKIIQVLDQTNGISYEICFIKVPSLHKSTEKFHLRSLVAKIKFSKKDIYEISRSSILNNSLLRYLPLNDIENWLNQFDLIFFPVGGLNELLPFKRLKSKKVGWVATDVIGDFDFRIKSQKSKVKKMYMHLYSKIMHQLQYSSGKHYNFIFPLSSSTKSALSPFCKENLLDPLIFPAEIKRTKVDFPEGEFRFISLGRVCDPRKDFKTLIHAFSKAYAKNKNISLTIMGQCSDDLIKQLPKKLNCDEAIKMTGFVSQKEKEQLLSQSHCFILTSRQEGLGIVYLEGQEYGLPCIATDNGGVSSIVFDGANGCIVPVGNLEALSEKILKLSQDKNFYQKLQKNVAVYLKKNNCYKVFKNRIQEIVLDQK